MSTNEEDKLGAPPGGTRLGGIPQIYAAGRMMNTRCAAASSTSSSSYGNAFKGAVKKSILSAMPKP